MVLWAPWLRNQPALGRRQRDHRDRRQRVQNSVCPPPQVRSRPVPTGAQLDHSAPTGPRNPPAEDEVRRPGISHRWSRKPGWPPPPATTPGNGGEPWRKNRSALPLPQATQWRSPSDSSIDGGPDVDPRHPGAVQRHGRERSQSTGSDRRPRTRCMQGVGWAPESSDWCVYADGCIRVPFFRESASREPHQRVTQTSPTRSRESSPMICLHDSST